MANYTSILTPCCLKFTELPITLSASYTHRDPLQASLVFSVHNVLPLDSVPTTFFMLPPSSVILPRDPIAYPPCM